jgi:8-oxo-dGTP pyrophosphatase MutT (NUDIX family)
MRIRNTARVLLLDPEDRILLMRARASREAEAYWFTVGGEIEPGETLLEAAAREIVEETGFTDAQLGPVPWRDEFVLAVRGEDFHFRQHYVVARTQGGLPSTTGWLAHEHELTDELRWWTLDELRAADKIIIYPIGLSEFLSDVLAGHISANPLLIHTLEGPVRPIPRPDSGLGSA